MLIPFYVTVIEQTLRERQRVNPRYSLRALAQSFDISPSTLSGVLKQKRHLPQKYVGIIVEKLGLSAEEAEKFRASLKYSRMSFIEGGSGEAPNKHLVSGADHYNIIAEWEYYAIFKLLDTNQDFDSPRQFARRLGISVARAREVLELLQRNKLIGRDDGRYVKLVSELTTTMDIPSRAIRASHRETLNLAAGKLGEVDISKRYFSSTTIAVDERRIDEAKVLYREFREKMSGLLKGEEATEVFQFSFQLFPLTQLEKVK